MTKQDEHSSASPAFRAGAGSLGRSWPLSQGQHALWTSYLIAPQSSAYNVPIAQWLADGTRLDSLRAAFRALLFRHPVLSAVIDTCHDEPRMRSHVHAEPSFECLQLPEHDDEALVEEARKLAKLPLDLEGGPLLRVRVLQGRTRTLLLTVVHHIACDGVSLGVLQRDLTRAYESIARGEPAPFREPLEGYEQFARAEQELLDGELLEADRAYWRSELAAGAPPLELPFGREAIAERSKVRHGGSVHAQLPAALGASLRAFASQQHLTPSTALMACFQLLLARYTGVDRVALAVPMEGRPLRELDEVIGYFVNVLPVVGELRNDASYQSLANALQDRVYEALGHGAFPVWSLFRDGKLKLPLHAGYYYQSWSSDFASQLGSLVGAPLLEVSQEGELDLILEVIELDQSFLLRFKYDAALYEQAAIERLAAHFEQLLARCLAQPKLALSAHGLLTEREAAQALRTWNQTEAPIERDSVLTMLAEQVARAPSRIAVQCQDEQRSYAQLAQASDAIAQALLQAGVKGGHVGVLLPRSERLPEALIGVLKSGAAYVPLDPDYPLDRLRYMLDDAGIEVLISDRSLTLLEQLGRRVLDVREAAASRAELALPTIDGAQAAYVIYTSGSTGKPKGVRISHRCFANFLSAMQREPGLSQDDVLGAITTPCFDIAGLELFLPLTVGARVEVAPAEVVRDGFALASWLERAGVNVLQATPASWQMLLQTEWTGHLRTILCGGEALNAQLAKDLRARCDALYNMYGPTETTVWSTLKRIDDGAITIGRPIANTAVYVLDAGLRPLPIGVPGELYIAGEGVALDYLGRSELTAERFVHNPFHAAWTRMYRTGDVARWREDGELECLGRADGQVKVRGHRVELQEVEAALRQHARGAEQAVVVARSNPAGHKQLFAFVRWREREDVAALQRELKRWLPEYMIPSRVIGVRDFPTTQNRKVDRSLLTNAPLPELERRFGTSEVVAPAKKEPASSQLPLLRELVARQLEVSEDELDLDATFGALGLDSLAFTALSVQLRKRLGQPVGPALFYEHASLRALAQHLDGQGAPAPLAQPALEAPRAIEPVAIVGVSLRLPGASDLDTLWQHLRAQRDLVGEVPRERWDYRTLPDGEHARWGGFLDEVDCFDARFFGLSPREAEQMDPQQRLLLETVWHCLDDANTPLAALQGSRTGVFMGVSGADFVASSGERPLEPYTLTGLSRSILTNRISFLLNIKGPSAPIDTACSSALVAVHRAVQSIQHGECEAALAGGVNLILSPFAHLAARKTGMMSPDGRCKPFDASGNGYVRSEGIVCFLLKPLSAALRDGDRVYAKIVASAENHGGRANSLTAPNAAAHVELIARALRRAGWDPRTIGYVETHGTGTALGDPIEVQGLRGAFESLLRERGDTSIDAPWCTLGSIKSNVGHLEAAAGAAGLLSALCVLREGEIAPLVHLQAPNPHLALEGGPFQLASALRPFPVLGALRRAALSSFGMGGSNAHVLLEQAEPTPAVATVERAENVFVYSAADPEALTRLLSAHLAAQHASLTAYAYTLQTGREALRERVAIVARNHDELRTRLELALRGEQHASVFRGSVAKNPGEGDGSSLPALAESWARGASVSFAGLYEVLPARVSLPRYPFARTVFSVRAGTQASPAEPGLRVPQIELDASGARITLRDEEVLREHVVGGEPVLPGVAHLELARLGLGLQERVEVRDVAWLTPVVGARELKLVRGDDGRFELRSTQAGRETVHSRGRIVALASEGERVDVPRAQAETHERQQGADAYAQFESFAFHYGTPFQVLREIQLGERTAVASLSSIPHWREEGEALHPIVLDAALQVASIMLGRLVTQPGERYLPFALERLFCHGRLQEAAFVVARLTSGPAAAVQKIDLDLVAADGTSLAALRGFSTRKTQRTATELSVWAPCWREVPQEAAPAPQLTVAFTCGDELSSARWPGRLITVQPGTQLRELGPDRFACDVASIPALVEKLAATSWLYGWHEPLADEPVQAQLTRAREGMLRLAQALSTRGAQRLLTFARPGRTTAALHEGLAAFARSAAQEQPKLQVSSVWLEHGGLDVLAEELANPSHTDVRRGRMREQRGLEAVPALNARFEPTGSYVLTGGAGALGRALSEQLEGAKLAWLVRKAPADRAAVEARGILIVETQLDDRASLERALAQVAAAHGPLHGVLHLAGTLHDEPLAKKSPETLHRVCAPKLEGTLLLDQLAEPRDFFVLFASTSGTFGNAGQADYALANAFLDGFAHEREQQRARGERSGITRVIDWSIWADGGMRMPEAAQRKLAQEAGIHPITREQGRAALAAALAGEQTQRIVFAAEPARLRSFFEQRGLLANKAPEPRTQVRRPMQPTAGRESLRAPLLTYLKETVAKATGLAPHALRDGQSFQEYGVDSVMTIELNRELEERFGALPATLFFEHSDFAQLSDFFLNEHLGAVKQHFALGEELEPLEDAREDEPVVEVARAPVAHEEDAIAIIGLAARFPQAEDLDAFWQNLAAGRDCIEEIPDERFSLEQYFDPSPSSQTSRSKWGGFLADVDKFDPLFFNISPFEAQLLDPQERLFLQAVWHTLEDAGYTRSALGKHHVGVYVGAMWGHYQLHGNGRSLDGSMLTPTSSYASIANRVSYFFNFRGPSIALDTMCSSSLTALHLACEDLRRGHTQLAIAGGVNVSVHPNKYVFLSQTGFAASDGRCRSFGEGGDGYVPGEGVGAVLLKPLRRALADGDRIHGVIRATSVNHGGRGNGYTVPNPSAQAELIRSAIERAALTPSQLDYVEAHGTGTSLGDPIELRGLSLAFGRDVPAQSCPIGSVKSNVGHLESAAGMAALAKVLLMMRHGELVPSLHADPPNAKIDFATSPFRVQRAREPWVAREGEPLRAAISSFGAGGANAHVIVEQAPARAGRAQRGSQPELIVLSARTSERLRAQAQQLASQLGEELTPSQGADAKAVRSLIGELLSLPVEQVEDPYALYDLGMEAAGAQRLAELLLERFGVRCPSLGVTTSVGSLITWCARSQPALEESEPLDLGDLAYTLQLGREAMDQRLAIVASKASELRAALRAFLAGQTATNLFVGSHQDSPNKALLLLQGDDGRAFLEGLLARARLAELAMLWTEGAALDFAKLKRAPGTRRVDAALYPFARERCWIPAELQKVPVRRFVRPLLDDIDPRASARGGLALTGVFRREEPWLRASLDAAQPLLPVSTFVELAAEALEQVAPGGGFVLHALQVEAPLALGEPSTAFVLQVREREEGVFALALEVAGTRHASALIEAHQSPVEKISLTSVREQSGEWLQPEAFASLAAKTGAGVVNHEPQCTLLLRDHEALLDFAFSPSRAGELERFAAAPRLWDSAFKLCTVLAGRREGPARGVEALESLTLHGPLPSRGSVYVQKPESGELSMLVVGEDGALHARAEGVRVGLLQDPLRDFFYLPEWRAVSALPPPQAAYSEAVLVYDAEQKPLADALHAALGHAASRLLLPEDAQLRAQALETHGRELAGSHVYWLCGATSSEPSGAALSAAIARSLESLLQLVHALEGALASPLALTIVTQRAFAVQSGDALSPVGAALAGFGRTLAREYPKLSLALVDLDDARSAEAVLQIAPTHAPRELAYRDGGFHERVLVPLALPVTPSALRDGGVYVILGGLGNVGFKLARHLAREHRAKLVLSGRRPEDASIGSRLDELRALGADVRYEAVDISDPASLKRVIASAKARHGAVHGVFHSAMHFEQTRLRELSEAMLRDHLAAKVQGAAAVYEAVCDEALDMLVYFSSGESFTGNPGWGSYAAGSTFLDAYADYARRQAAFPVHTVNWGFWDGDIGEFGEVLKTRGIRPIEEQRGMEALDRLLAARVPQALALDVKPEIVERMGADLTRRYSLAHGEGGFHERLRSASREHVALPARKERAAQVPLALRQLEPSTQQALPLPEATEQLVRTLFTSALKLKPEDVQPQRSFADYGADSLVITEVHKKFEEKLGKLPATFLLENESIAAATAYLLAEHRPLLESVFAGSAKHVAAPAVERPAAPVTAIRKPSVERIARVTVAERARYLDDYGNRWQSGALAKQPTSDAGALDSRGLEHLVLQVSPSQRLEATLVGQGSPVLMIPPIGLTAPVWHQQLAAWSKHHQMIVLHHPGYGLSDPQKSFANEAIVELFARGLDMLGISEPVHVMAGCFGGVAAQGFAASLPERTRSLTLVGCFYRNFGLPDMPVSELSIDDMIQATRAVADSIGRDFDIVSGSLPPQADQHALAEAKALLLRSLCAKPVHVMRYIAEILRFEGLDALRRITAPVLTVAGTVDTIVAPETSAFIAEQVGDGRLWSVEGAGHYPYLTHAAAFNTRVLDFIRSVESQIRPAATTITAEVV